MTDDAITILVNGLHAKSGGGVTYVRNIVRFMAGHPNLKVILCIHANQLKDFNELTPSVQLHVVDIGVGLYRLLVWEQIALPLLVRRLGAQVTFSPANYGPMLATNHVIVVHNSLAVGGIDGRWSRKFYWLGLKVMTILCLHQAKRAITVSNHVKSQILHWRRGDVPVIPHGIDPVFHPDPSIARDPNLILAVADIYVQKNLHTLLKAFRHLSLDRPHLRLVVAGQPIDHQYNQRLMEYVKAHGLEGRVDFIGRVNRERLRDLYCRCRVFAFPSLEEAFGMPLTEAMACGAAVVCADRSAMPEVAGDAALQVDAASPERLAAGLARVLDDAELAAELGRRGLERAGLYSWERATRSLVGVFREVAGPIKPVADDGVANFFFRLAERLLGTDGKQIHRPVRVCINAIHAKSGGGVTYLTNIVPLLCQDRRLRIHLILDQEQEKVLDFVDTDITVHYLPKFVKRIGASLAEQIVVPWMAYNLGADVTYSPANFGPLLAPKPVIMMRNAFTVGNIETRLSKRLYWGAVFIASWLSYLSACRALTVSNFARQLFLRSFRLPDNGKVVVVPHGVRPHFQPGGAEDRRDDSLLVVCDIYIQKNLHTLLRAVKIIKDRRGDVRLVIAGHPLDRQYHHELLRIRDDLGLVDDVAFVGRKSSDELSRMYQTCGVFVFPSTVETFGNPLVEAMASGAPIASSQSAAMPEVLGDAGIYFPPEDCQLMADAIIRILDDKELAADLGRRGIARAKNFSWQHSAQLTADVMCEVAGHG